MSNKMIIITSELLNAKKNSVAAFEEAVNTISLHLLEEAERGNWGNKQSGSNGPETENENLGLCIPAKIDLTSWQAGDPLTTFRNAYGARLIVNVIFHHDKIAEIIYTLMSELLPLIETSTNNNESKNSSQDYGRAKPMPIDEIVNMILKIVNEKKMEIDLQRFRKITTELENEHASYDRESRLSDWQLDRLQQQRCMINLAGSDVSNNDSSIVDVTNSINNEYLHFIDDKVPLSVDTISTTLPRANRERPMKNIFVDPSKTCDEEERPWNREWERTGYSVLSFQSIWTRDFADYPTNLIETIVKNILSKYIVPLRDVFHACFHLLAHLKCARIIDDAWYERTTFTYNLPSVYSVHETWLELEILLNAYACVAKIFLNIYSLYSSSSSFESGDTLNSTRETYVKTLELLECLPVFIFDGKWMDNNFYSWPHTRRSAERLPVRDYLSENHLLKTVLVVPSQADNRRQNIMRLKIKAVETITSLRAEMQGMFDDGFVTIVNQTHKSNLTSSNDKIDTSISDFNVSVLHDSAFQNNPYIVHPLYHLKIIHRADSDNKRLASIEEWDARFHLSSESGTLTVSQTGSGSDSVNEKKNNSSWFWRTLPLFKPSLLNDSSNSPPCNFWEEALQQIHNHHQEYGQVHCSKNTKILQDMIASIEHKEKSIEEKKKKNQEDIIIKDRQLECYERQEERRLKNMEQSIFLTILCKNLLTTLMNIYI